MFPHEIVHRLQFLEKLLLFLLHNNFDILEIYWVCSGKSVNSKQLLASTSFHILGAATVEANTCTIQFHHC